MLSHRLTRTSRPLDPALRHVPTLWQAVVMEHSVWFRAVWRTALHWCTSLTGEIPEFLGLGWGLGGRRERGPKVYILKIQKFESNCSNQPFQ